MKVKRILKSSETKFWQVFVIDAILLWLLWNVIDYFIRWRTNKNLNNLILSIVLSLAFVAFSFHNFKLIKKELGKLPYSYGNIYLFRRFTFIYEALIVVSLSFLLGISSSAFAIFEIDDVLTQFKFNALLIGANCIVSSTKAMLGYTFTVWDATHKKRGETPYG